MPSPSIRGGDAERAVRTARVVQQQRITNHIALAVIRALDNFQQTAIAGTSTVFNYDTTGSLESWLYDKAGISTVLVELGSNTNNEFWKNKAAMWAMVP